GGGGAAGAAGGGVTGAGSFLTIRLSRDSEAAAGNTSRISSDGVLPFTGNSAAGVEIDFTVEGGGVAGADVVSGGRSRKRCRASIQRCKRSNVGGSSSPRALNSANWRAVVSRAASSALAWPLA